MPFLFLSCDVPGIKRLLPSQWRESKFFDNIYELVGVPVVTVQLRYNGWVTELQDLERSRQLQQASGLDNLLYTPDADFSCFADLALTSPEDYYIEGQGSLLQCVLTPGDPYMSLTNDKIIERVSKQVLEAFASWLRLRHGIPGSVLACHPLVYTALSSLSSETLSEAVVNVISELIYYSTAGNSGGIPVQMPLIQVIVLQVMSLKEQLRDSSKDEEDVKAIARLFADMGDLYVELIATGSDESIMIVNALLEVASHPEYDIASMTFNFWHSLQHILTKRDPYTSFGNEVSNEGERSRRLQVFRSVYEFLVSLVSFRVKYPQDYQTLSVEDLKEFKQTRYAVADVLIDSASVLGGDATLRILYVKLYEALSCFGEWTQSMASSRSCSVLHQSYIK
ncbi:hypothetical protein OIU77_007778 [Salix suchowensis]|nr:hypothetical protein OIU77_007778 [Salix suchowensis]